MEYVVRHPQKQLSTVHPPELPQRLWAYLLEKHLGHRAHAPWGSLNQKEMNRLMNGLTNDQYEIVGRAPFKDEFVTCGGINLTAVDSNTLEYRLSPQQQAGNRHPRLFFAGEVLDIDGITGGFNFQAAWTTAYVVAKAISHASHNPQGENFQEGDKHKEILFKSLCHSLRPVQ
jgi:predicted flavoprotein YhiN